MELHYLPLDEADPSELIALLNQPRVRTHLVEHVAFDRASIARWVAAKMDVDNTPGCRVRAVMVKGRLAGWCGIQPDEGGYEIGIVLADEFWGAGKPIFIDMMAWAREFGHEEVRIHLLETRREYRFLQRLASRVDGSMLMGRNFRTYHLPVANETSMVDEAL